MSRDLVLEALTIRDSSLAQVHPEVLLDQLPTPLPKNVSQLPNIILTPEEIRITSHDAPDLLEAIRKREVSCVEVTNAFLRRAALVQKLVSFKSKDKKMTTRHLMVAFLGQLCNRTSSTPGARARCLS